MTTPKTIRVRRTEKSPLSPHKVRYEGDGYVVYSTDVTDEELDITITPVKSAKQRRREAREEAVRNRVGAYVGETVDAIEQADAEFDQAREAEVTGKLRVALEDFWRLRLRAYEDGTASKMELAYESALDAIEAIYRGER